MENILQELEDEGYKIEVNFVEKERIRVMRESIKKIKESGDENKIRYVKKLARYYYIFKNIGCIIKPEISLEEDKYFSNYLHTYLDIFVDTSKRVIVGVIKAFADDEPIDPFCKYLMFTHLYTPEQVKEIGHEEINRMEEELYNEIYYDDN